MTKSKKIVIAAGVGGLVLIVAWFLLLFQPQANKLSEVEEQVDEAKAEQTALRAELADLKVLKKTEPQIDEQLGLAAALMPNEPALAEFIREADQAAIDAGLFWATVTPGAPETEAAIGVITVGVDLSGGYFEVVDYLQRMESLSRLVTFDTMQLAPSGEPGVLNAQLVGRMFVYGDGAGGGGDPAGSESATPAPA